MLFFSVGQYASNLTSGTISCTISAQEDFVPIRITGGLSVSLFPSQPCENATSQPNPVFLTNLTRVGGMSLEKMQGQDGKLEAISYIPQGTDRINALELGITRLVSVAATEMYSTIDALKGSNATWANTQDYLFQTDRYRLGVKGTFKPLFILSPGILILIILVAWFLIGIMRSGDRRLIGFNPLDPGSAIVAGMNRDGTRLPAEIINYSEVNADILEKSDVLIRYGEVKGNRMGIEVMDGTYIPDGAGEGRPLSAYKDESPAPSPTLFPMTPLYK